MINTAILMGRLTAAPELKQTVSGIPFCNFCVAVNRPYSKDKEQQTDFINIVSWRNTAEFVAKYFSKGFMIIITGSIRTRNYEDKNGNKRTATEVLADTVQFGETKKQASESNNTTQYNSSRAIDVPAAADESFDSEDLPF